MSFVCLMASGFTVIRIKAMWSGELSDKNNGSSYLCLLQHQNKELHINVILNQTMGRKQGFTKLGNLLEVL